MPLGPVDRTERHVCRSWSCWRPSDTASVLSLQRQREGLRPSDPFLPIIDAPSAHRGQDDAVRGRWIVGGLVVVVALVGLAVFLTRPETDADRTDRILTVYAQQLGISDDEAREHQDQALEIAEVYCSIEASNLVEFMAGTTTPVEDAIAYAEAACPKTAQEFKEAVEPDHICELARESARLTAGDTSLSEEDRRERLDEIAAELADTGPPEVRDFYVTVSTIEDLPPSEQEAVLRDLSQEVGAILDERCG